MTAGRSGDVPGAGREPDRTHPIDRLTEADGPALHAHLTECWTAHYGKALGPSVAHRMCAALTDTAASVMPGPGGVGLCVRADRQIVATCVGQARDGVGHVWGCYVRPRWQGRGLGRCLMRAMQAELAAGTVAVHVLDASPGAQAFYRLLGFRTAARTRVEIVPGLDVPASVMVADLPVTGATHDRLVPKG